MITKLRLQELLTYIPETGEFIRNVTTSSRSIKGQMAGCKCPKRNRVLITIDSKSYDAKYLACLFMLGFYPETVVNLNGNTSDNRWKNLEITHPILYKDTLTQEQARQCFYYDEDTGIITNKVSFSSTSLIGNVSTTLSGNGYLYMASIQDLPAHRFIMLYMLGMIPEMTDHIDRNKLNNRWNNLRPACACTNKQNSRTYNENKNINYNKKSGLYIVAVRAFGKNHFGYSKDIEEARRIAKNLRETLHKEFANHG